MQPDIAPSVADARRAREAITREDVEFWAGEGVYVRGRIVEVADTPTPNSRTRTSCTMLQIRVTSVEISERTEIKL